MNGSVFKGKYDLEKTDRIKAIETDSLEQVEFFNEPSALKLPGPPSSDFGFPMEETTNSQTMLDAIRDLQSYQNNWIEKIIAQEKKEK
jgi:hypothetical protein